MCNKCNYEMICNSAQRLANAYKKNMTVYMFKSTGTYNFCESDFFEKNYKSFEIYVVKKIVTPC